MRPDDEDTKKRRRRQDLNLKTSPPHRHRHMAWRGEAASSPSIKFRAGSRPNLVRCSELNPHPRGGGSSDQQRLQSVGFGRRLFLIIFGTLAEFAPPPTSLALDPPVVDAMMSTMTERPLDGPG
ncbi:hypothetical protein PLICRDRAFT_175758 [Plicaturopsis crispa FD-325 SS-3]|nr:hypothetical protein PLICRDRAFT_175758 [Plicaturopsis crispa FD-325 SS-3]